MIDVFISVGRTWSDEKEEFVRSVYAYLRENGFNPQTVGRNNQPNRGGLQAIKKLMRSSSGIVVIAFERIRVLNGFEHKKDDDGAVFRDKLDNCTLTTPWNHIEAAMAFSYDMPVLVICEKGVKAEGVVENVSEWYVQRVDLKQNYLKSEVFSAVFKEWSDEVKNYKPNRLILENIEDQSIFQTLKKIRFKEASFILTVAIFLMTLGAFLQDKMGIFS